MAWAAVKRGKQLYWSINLTKGELWEQLAGTGPGTLHNSVRWLRRGWSWGLSGRTGHTD